jgi:hypothetical protein
MLETWDEDGGSKVTIMMHTTRQESLSWRWRGMQLKWGFVQTESSPIRKCANICEGLHEEHADFNASTKHYVLSAAADVFA